MSEVDDGYIVGALAPRPKRCPRCGLVTRCIDITGVTLPKGFGVEATILYDRKQEATLPSIGLGCGDYARFHRQIAHIVDGRLRGGHSV